MNKTFRYWDDSIDSTYKSVNHAETAIFVEVIAELQSARQRYPSWPDDIVHATVVMVEEATEALKAANEVRWQHKETTPADVRKEVIQTIAMCLRLLTETPGL